MKVFLYVNKAKDEKQIYTKQIVSILENEKIEYEFVDGSVTKKDGDALIVFGGDGTILKLNKFAYLNSLPIITINAGTIGFLTEFELHDIADAIKCLLSGKLIRDVRTNIAIYTEDRCYIALNEAVVQRVFSEKDEGIVSNLTVNVDNNDIETVVGDGVIVATQTGSTAYSLSAGGAVLAPGVDAFQITAIAPHSFSNRPIVCSSQKTIKITNTGDNNTALFVDGRFVETVKKGQVITIVKAKKDTVFLRKASFNFYDRLIVKLNRGGVKI